MAFETFADFFAMGGHAPYVWASWGVTAVLLVALVLHARAERRQLLRHMKRRMRREDRHSSRAMGAVQIQTSRGGNANDA